MASFNQSPLSQTPLTLNAFSVLIGSQLGSVAIAVNLDIQKVTGIASNKSALAEEPAVYPGWRRELRK